MTHTTSHEYHHDLACVLAALRAVLDRRALAVLSGTCPACLTSAWMSAVHPAVSDGWSVGLIAPSSLKASFEYNEEWGLGIGAFLEHVQPTVLVLNAAADEADSEFDPLAVLRIQERFIRARLDVGLATLVLTHQPVTYLDPDLLEMSGSAEPFLVMPEHHTDTCIR